MIVLLLFLKTLLKAGFMLDKFQFKFMIIHIEVSGHEKSTPSSQD